MDELYEMHDIITGIRDILRESSNAAQNIDTIIYELISIKQIKISEELRKLKGEYDLNGTKGTIYDKYELRLLKPLLNISTKYWNPNYEFVSWEELFSKIDKIDNILAKIESQKEELENILIKSLEIKTRISKIFEYIPKA